MRCTKLQLLAICTLSILQLTFLFQLNDSGYRSSTLSFAPFEYHNGRARTSESSNRKSLLSDYENVWTLDKEDCQSAARAPMVKNPLEMDENSFQPKHQASSIIEKAQEMQRAQYNRSSFTHFRNNTRWQECLSEAYHSKTPPSSDGKSRLIHRFSHSDMDVVIPTARLTCLNPMAIRNLNYFQGPRRIFIITPFDVSLCSIFEAMAENIVCIPESSFAGHLSVENVTEMIPEELKAGKKRAGWYFQQFIKLGVSQWIDDLSEYYIVWDGDFIPINGRPWVYQRSNQTFLSTDLGIGGGNNNIHLSMSCYKQTYMNFFGNPGHVAPDETSHVVHQMVMRKNEVIHMLVEMTARKTNYTRDNNILGPPATVWAGAIIASVVESFHLPIRHKRKRCDKVGFSEYHSYASFVHDIYGTAAVCQNPTIAFHRTWGPMMPQQTRRSKDTIGACCPTEEWLCDKVQQLGEDITYVGVELGQTDGVDTCGWKSNDSPIYP
ncbi:unnamed protein product [Cylindrotheca closterium]|uniref:Nucleotide-diphospho-sugar transferase domain-containing protein n=1 Tax=Cylindrotheca closterium TaxID=2856 RepID=A0AAD2FF80_9STRA|nr:unnamed protein product [Cylindrotheca closterium]